MARAHGRRVREEVAGGVRAVFAAFSRAGARVCCTRGVLAACADLCALHAWAATGRVMEDGDEQNATCTLGCAEALRDILYVRHQHALLCSRGPENAASLVVPAPFLLRVLAGLHSLVHRSMMRGSLPPEGRRGMRPEREGPADTQ